MITYYYLTYYMRFYIVNSMYRIVLSLIILFILVYGSFKLTKYSIDKLWKKINL